MEGPLPDGAWNDPHQNDAYPYGDRGDPHDPGGGATFTGVPTRGSGDNEKARKRENRGKGVDLELSPDMRYPAPIGVVYPFNEDQSEVLCVQDNNKNGFADAPCGICMPKNASTNQFPRNAFYSAKVPIALLEAIRMFGGFEGDQKASISQITEAVKLSENYAQAARKWIEPDRRNGDDGRQSQEWITNMANVLGDQNFNDLYPDISIADNMVRTAEGFVGPTMNHNCFKHKPCEFDNDKWMARIDVNKLCDLMQAEDIIQFGGQIPIMSQAARVFVATGFRPLGRAFQGSMELLVDEAAYHRIYRAMNDGITLHDGLPSTSPHIYSGSPTKDWSYSELKEASNYGLGDTEQGGEAILIGHFGRQTPVRVEDGKVQDGSAMEKAFNVMDAAHCFVMDIGRNRSLRDDGGRPLTGLLSTPPTDEDDAHGYKTYGACLPGQGISNFLVQNSELTKMYAEKIVSDLGDPDIGKEWKDTQCRALGLDPRVASTLTQSAPGGDRYQYAAGRAVGKCIEALNMKTKVASAGHHEFRKFDPGTFQDEDDARYPVAGWVGIAGKRVAENLERSGNASNIPVDPPLSNSMRDKFEKHCDTSGPEFKAWHQHFENCKEKGTDSTVILNLVYYPKGLLTTTTLWHMKAQFSQFGVLNRGAAKINDDARRDWHKVETVVRGLQNVTDKRFSTMREEVCVAGQGNSRRAFATGAAVLDTHAKIDPVTVVSSLNDVKDHKKLCVLMGEWNIRALSIRCMCWWS